MGASDTLHATGARELIRPDLVFVDLDVDNSAQLFDALEHRLAAGGYVAPTWREAIEQRERTYPTGLTFPGGSVAIPHVDPEHVLRSYIALVRPLKPVTFEFMGGMGDPVKAELVVNLGITRKGGHLQMLQQLIDLFMSGDSVSELLSQKSPEDLYTAFVHHFE